MEHRAYCKNCEEFVYVQLVDDSFDYAGTHCTGGVGGTHRVIYWQCTQCENEVNYSPPEPEEDGWTDSHI